MLAAGIRCGKICELCRGGKCIDEPSPLEPLSLECDCCSGMGCEYCTGGYVMYTSCPQQEVPREIINVVSVSDVFEFGVLPKQGGLDDQDAFFVNCMSNLKRNESRLSNG